MRTCRSCFYWSDEGDGSGQCERHAPRLVQTNTPDAPDERIWPVTYSGDSCGEHSDQPSIEVIAAGIARGLSVEEAGKVARAVAVWMRAEFLTAWGEPPPAEGAP